MKNKKTLKKILIVLGIFVILCLLAYAVWVAWPFITGKATYSDGFIYEQY